eukprot:CAMPEP_0203803608 /NCGR_PEP_ID=MMETSP0100_2-20121128/12985_1 /ASSEMBLY_ACC=CAM_ASM_000210 /TAXON_ID=96639 /ORGANISM=" , Strain NY0313808BC1" /LENGTH=418 /DNA_ID=CAMNT_0050711457 /DNA_START=465 /DNA_END=1724 /DNA_ORIENTATION=+
MEQDVGFALEANFIEVDPVSMYVGDAYDHARALLQTHIEQLSRPRKVEVFESISDLAERSPNEFGTFGAFRRHLSCFGLELDVKSLEAIREVVLEKGPNVDIVLFHKMLLEILGDCSSATRVASISLPRKCTKYGAESGILGDDTPFWLRKPKKCKYRVPTMLLRDRRLKEKKKRKGSQKDREATLGETKHKKKVPKRGVSAFPNLAKTSCPPAPGLPRRLNSVPNDLVLVPPEKATTPQRLNKVRSSPDYLEKLLSSSAMVSPKPFQLPSRWTDRPLATDSKRIPGEADLVAKLSKECSERIKAVEVSQRSAGEHAMKIVRKRIKHREKLRVLPERKYHSSSYSIDVFGEVFEPRVLPKIARDASPKVGKQSLYIQPKEYLLPIVKGPVYKEMILEQKLKMAALKRDLPAAGNSRHR